MNKTRSGLKTLLIVAIIVCSGLITSFPDMKDTEETPTAHSEENLKSDWCDIMVRASPDIYGSSITRIEITSPHAYTISSHQPVHIPDSYVIEYREGEYRSGDARVDPDLVERLRMSLANFYECKAPYKYIQSKSESSLLVNITFENGKFVTLMSGSPEDCFTPWVAEYDGNLYYQYSGILTSAVQRVLLFLDSFKWYIASEPHYYDGKIYVFAITRLFALDSETKNIVWEVDLIRGGSPPEAADLTIHEGALYMIDIVITTVRISKIDASSGTILWEYSYNYRGLTNFRGTPPLEFYNDTLLVAFYGAVCLNIETGEEIWRKDIDFGYVINDKYLVFGYEDTFFYGLADIGTGEVIWKREGYELLSSSSHDGTLYFEKGDEVVSVSVDTLKETRFYMYGEEWPNQKADLRTFHVCDSGILIMLRGPHPEYDEVKLVFLNFDGSERWEYAYSSVQHPTLPVRGIDVLQNMLYVIRETVKDETPKGLIEAFDINNGNLYWQKEVEGNIERFHFHKRLFVFTDKCRAYCFDTLTGEVLWELIADDCAVRCLDTLTGEVLWEYEIFGDCHPTGCWSIHCLCSCDRFSLHISDIVEGFIFMGVKNRLIVFSLEKDNSIHPGVFQIT